MLPDLLGTMRHGVRHQRNGQRVAGCSLSRSFLTNQCLQGRFGILKRDIDSTLSLTSSFGRYRETKDALQDVHSAIDGITQEARWPTECQVILERIRHIEYVPASPEPYYVPTGKEPQPKAVGDEFGSIVFHYCPLSVTNYFSRSCIGGTVVVMPDQVSSLSTVQVVPQVENPPPGSDLLFESRFESGNLGKVIKITDTYYQLHLRRDLYTQRHMQWYYFRISNTRSRTIYRLSIVNFCKEDSLYNEGLKPLLYSTKDASINSVGWRRCGDNITYYRNDSSDEEKEKHTLTFNVSFPHDQDTVYLAHCYPYTYTDLQEYLGTIVSDPVKTKFTKLRLLCRTLAGNNVYYLTITAPMLNDEAKKKKGVVITARVHPGETPSSWMMKGIIDFLTGDSNQARELRERFIFKLVPMLNPDGVIVGNNRCSLSGKDLNRQYRTVMRESYPSVWHTKLMIRRLMEECGMAIYCDLHAHSRKHNVFIYGCESKRPGCYGKLTEQVFPLMLHKNAADKFSFESCKFHIEKGKEGTGRVVVWLMGVPNSYTMEASLGGSTLGSRTGTHFSTQDYEQIGKAFCETLLDFSDEDPVKERLRNKIIARLVQEGSSADEPTNINLTDYSSDEGDTSDSTSENESKLMDTVETIERMEIEDTRYLCIPAPLYSPKVRSINKSRKTRKKSAQLSKTYSTNRAAIDLPITDPGSDLYDLTDSADDNYTQSPVKTNRKEKNKRSRRRLREKSNRLEKEEDSKKDFGESSSLPLLVRPRSLSLGEELLVDQKQPSKAKQYSHSNRLPRTHSNLSSVPLKSQEMQIKLTALRQQIWTGKMYNASDGDDFKSPFVQNLMSWGIADLALSYQTDVEMNRTMKKATLEKVEKKTKKKCSKKQLKVSSISPGDEAPEDEEKKTLKKKRARFKRQKTINVNINTPEFNPALSRPDKIDSFKLFGIGKLPKVDSKQKIDPKRKCRKTGTSTVLITDAPKAKPKPAETLVDSSSSDDVVTGTRPKLTRKKKKPIGGKKRASSAGLIISSIKEESK
ncbi:cytosolic carboxypeptidase 2 [Orussus abietinus]|uniref:cytosolic carboxypeptidase 2 n=1 Tax=Orussus abietinus TaxID=222816 RepID=UPI000C71621D|nr:cytosolic carboxypeptidase 2 [Orussus abietinus]